MRRVVSGLLLTCEQCVGMSDDTARGWRAYHGREDDTQVVVVLCPDCAEAFDADTGD